MQDAANTFDEKINALRKYFLQQLPGRIVQVQDTWKALTAGEWNPAVAKALERMVHQLIGSAASFGLESMSDTARSLDTTLKAVVAAGTAPSEQQRAEVEALLAALRSAAATSEHALTPYRSFDALRDSRPAPREGSADGERQLVYLVEDDLVLAQDLALQIGYFGYDVKIFGQLSGLKAALAEACPAALVMDIVFPEGDLAGTEIVSQTRLAGERSIPVIFISVRTDLLARLQAVQAGGDAYFAKPVNTSELIEKLDELSGREIPDPFRILIVDDSRTSAAYHSAILEEAGMLTAVVGEPLRIMQPLVDFRPDMILMDMHMPDYSGSDLAKVLRQQRAYFWLPIVFLSAEAELDKQLEALNQSGGDVFLTKPIEPQNLISVVSSRVERSRTLRSLMIRDSLTELFNHTTIKESLEHELAKAKRRAAPLAFAMLDFDHFKQINDAYGHAVGDHVLKSIARLLRQRLRKSDVIGRYGGDEFAVILPNTGGADAVHVMNELRETFARVRHRPTAQADFVETFSCGVASFPPRDEASDLSAAADHALYEAKRRGRNQVVLDGS